MTNPWLHIPAGDYEGHMGPDHADQLGPLAAIFGDVYRRVRPARLALLGCATGNGLGHVDAAVTRQAIAVDFNPQYVALARERHRALGLVLEVRCDDLLTCALPARSFDLVHAALIFEHVDPAALAARIAAWLAPRGTCAIVLQSGDADSPAAIPVMPSPYHSVASLGASMRLVPPDDVIALLEANGLHPTDRWTVPLKGGRRFEVLLSTRAAPPPA
jgi:hypothetical protein